VTAGEVQALAAEHVLEEARRILARAEFERESTMLEDALRWLFEHDVSLPSGLAGRVFPVLLGVLGAVVIWRFVRATRRAARPDHGEPRAASREARARELLRRARAARAAGDLRLALRLSFFALVIGLGERGDLRYRDSWTYRELLRRGKPARAVHEVLTGLVHDLEAKEFGRAQATEDDLRRVDELCRRYLGARVAGA
jgi:hypothetical protein